MSLKPVTLPHIPRHIRRAHVIEKHLQLRLERSRPFFRDPEHTVPTKWSLYRPLLRLSGGSPHPIEPSSSTAPPIEPSSSTAPPVERSSSTAPRPKPTPYPHIHEEVKLQFRKFISLTSLTFTRTVLTRHLNLLSALREGDAPVLEELETRLTARHEANAAKAAAAAAATAAREASQAARRPRLTGGFLRPTLFNPPLPRIKPQPPETGVIIAKRTRRRQTRMDRYKEVAELQTDMEKEAEFEETVLQAAAERFEKVLVGPTDGSASESKGEGKAKRKAELKLKRELESTLERTPERWLELKRKLEHEHALALRARIEGKPGVAEWKRPLRAEMEEINDKFTAEKRRAAMVYTPRLMRAVQKAKERKEKWLEERRAERKAEKVIRGEGTRTVGAGVERKKGEESRASRESKTSGEKKKGRPRKSVAEAEEKPRSRSGAEVEATPAAGDAGGDKAKGEAKSEVKRSRAKAEDRPAARKPAAKAVAKDEAEEGTDGAKERKTGARTRKTGVRKAAVKKTTEEGEDKGAGDGRGRV